MSNQRQRDHGRDSPPRHRKSHRRRAQNCQQVSFCEREYGIRKKQRDPVSSADSSSSNNGRKVEVQRSKQWKNRKTINQKEMQLLKEKLDEIEFLREQIEVFQILLSSQDSVKSSSKASSRFSFPDCKNYNLDSFENYDHKKESLQHKPNARIHNRSKKSRKRGPDLKDSNKGSRITNNNTIVLPEGYALSRQPSGDQVMMSNLNEKLELQVSEIKQIKERLNECMELLKEANCAKLKAPGCRLILDDYINMNKTNKFDKIFPNLCAEDGFLSAVNHSEKRFNEIKNNTVFEDEDIFAGSGKSQFINTARFTNFDKVNKKNTRYKDNFDNFINSAKKYKHPLSVSLDHLTDATTDRISYINKRCDQDGKKVNYKKEELFDQKNTSFTDTPVIQSFTSSEILKKTSVSTEDGGEKFPKSVQQVYCQSRKKQTVLKVSPFTCSDGGKCKKPPKSITNALSTYSVVAASRKEREKILKSKGTQQNQPVKSTLKQSASSMKSPTKVTFGLEKPKESCFVRFVKFFCCKSNKK